MERLNFKGEYKNGKAHKLWSFYYLDGRLQSKGERKNEKIIGLWYELRHDK